MMQTTSRCIAAVEYKGRRVDSGAFYDAENVGSDASHFMMKGPKRRELGDR